MLTRNRLDRPEPPDKKALNASGINLKPLTPSLYPPPYLMGIVQGGGSVTTPNSSTFGKELAGKHRAEALLDTIATTEHRIPTPRTPRPTPKPNKLKDKASSKSALVDLLEDVGTPLSTDLARRVDACCRRWSVRKCSTGHILEFRPTANCQLKYCPFCAVRRANRSKGIYAPAIAEYLSLKPHLKPFFLTLTLKHLKGESAEAMLDRLKDGLKKLRRRKYWKQYFPDGGVFTVEFTVGKDGGWHFHAHAIVFALRSINPKDLANLWAEVTGDSSIIKLKRIRNTDSALVELIKYITKPADIYQWTSARMAELLRLKDKRFIEPVGEFRTFLKEYNKRKKQEAKDETVERVDPFPVGDRCPRGDCAGDVLPDAFVPVSQLIHLLDTQSDWSQRIDDWESTDPPDWEESDHSEWDNTPPSDGWGSIL